MDRILNAHHRGKMKDAGASFRQQCYERTVLDRSLMERNGIREAGKILPIALAQVIKNDDFVSVPHEAFAQVAADESSPAGDQVPRH